MFVHNKLEYAGVVIDFDPDTKNFNYRSFSINDAGIEFIDMGCFNLSNPDTLIMSNGCCNGIREIIIINNKIGSKTVKLKFKMPSEEITSNKINEIINSLIKKAK